jgi:spore coat protein A, manganese oxidase
MSKQVSRRKFLRMAARAGIAAGVTAAMPWACSSGGSGPIAVSGSTATGAGTGSAASSIRKFVISLPGVGPAGANQIGQYLPLATKSQQIFAGMTTDVYNLAVGQFSQRLHPDLPKATVLRGYYDLTTKDHKYLGGVVVSKRGTPVLFNITNNLPNTEIIPIDKTIMAGLNGLTVGDLPLNRIANHLHGGFTPWFSDGTPLQWFDPNGLTGTSFMNVPGTNPAVGTATYYYPMDQSARFAWYHDHAMGITRTNAYSGIASALILVDDFEINLVNTGLLPDLVGIPLVIQDKGFVPANIHQLNKDWKWGAPGDLWYPPAYLPNVLANGMMNPKGKWDWGPTVDPASKNTLPLPLPSIVPEAFFDTILVNGAAYPYVNVPAKRVRVRMLNGSQARFLHMNLYAEDSNTPGEADTTKPGPKMYQVGTEGGFLPAVAVHDNTTPIPLDLNADLSGNTANPDGPFNLLLAPAERADIIIDFNGVPAGTTFILYNDAPSPFPGGDSRNDYYTGDPDQTPYGGADTTQAGYGPNTQTLMKFVVIADPGDAQNTASWVTDMNNQLRGNFASGNQPGLLYNDGNPWDPGAVPYTGSVDRVLTLNEDFDNYGRLIQTIGTDTSLSTNNQGLNSWGLPYTATATETPTAGSTEVWQIINLTGDTHPIHFHLVNVQLIQRQAFTGDPSSGISFSGPPTPPDANEIGWKETVRMNPGEVTTVVMKFDLPVLPTAAMTNAKSPRTGGHEYVWHCHILEHEEHDMMRPLVVK